MNVCAGEGWTKLCPFLRADIPARPFPHENRSARFWFESDDFIREIPTWQSQAGELSGRRDLHLIDTATHNFRAGLWMLHNLCTHQTSRITCSDIWKESNVEQAFDYNVRLSRWSHKIRKINGHAIQVLATTPPCTADLVRVSVCQNEKDRQEKLLLAYRALKPGGILACKEIVPESNRVVARHQRSTNNYPSARNPFELLAPKTQAESLRDLTFLRKIGGAAT